MPLEMQHDIADIDEDINADIDNLLSNRFDRLYERNRFKNTIHSIDIISPTLGYNGKGNIALTPDKIRYLLSFYPMKEDLVHIDKIVLRPRYVEVGNVELAALYLRNKKILVMYLVHPFLYKVTDTRFTRSGELLAIDAGKTPEEPLDRESHDQGAEGMFVHPLWYILSTIRHAGDDKIDKFFVKRENEHLHDALSEALNDISFYYSRHGY